MFKSLKPPARNLYDTLESQLKPVENWGGNANIEAGDPNIKGQMAVLRSHPRYSFRNSQVHSWIKQGDPVENHYETSWNHQGNSHSITRNPHEVQLNPTNIYIYKSHSTSKSASKSQELAKSFAKSEIDPEWNPPFNELPSGKLT